MTKRTKTKFYVVMGLNEDGALRVISREMSYSFDAAIGFIFAQRKAAEKMARAYGWRQAEVYSLQGVAYDITKMKSHKLAKEAAEKMFTA